MNDRYTIRLITPADAKEALDVYAPYVLTTANTFEYVVPSETDFLNKIEKITAQYPWLVCTHNGKVIGYAYGSTHRDREAYQWSPEATVYIAEDHHRKGIATVLYNALFKILRMQGYINIYAGVLMTNEESVGFHRAMGFHDIGIYRNIGYKLGEWRSNLWLELHLQDHKINPPVPLSVHKLIGTPAFDDVILDANNSLKTRAIKAL